MPVLDIANLAQEVLRRPIESTQYLSIRYSERLARAGIEASVGSRGDAYDNEMAESVIGLLTGNYDGPASRIAVIGRGEPGYG